MQTDMHYYATYAIGRAAGFRGDVARAIATAAEYVDDSDRLDVTCKDGFRIQAEPTAHHPTNLKANTDPADQCRTWVPFHFIPGGKGKTAEEKLLCVTDSEIAQSIVAHTLSNLDKPFGVMLLGILAHCYVDTFSHYGFSGISSKLNKVKVGSIKTRASKGMDESLGARFEAFFHKYAVGPFANCLVQLGHGSVATYPDQPFLKWQFVYDYNNKTSGLRENPKTFLAGCRRLHETFVSARAKFNGVHDDTNAYRDFKDIERAVREVLSVEGDANARTNAWQTAMKAGRICRTKEEIPAYNPGTFTRDLEALHTYERDFATQTVVYTFLEAADFHRNFVLNELLPKHGIDIQSAPVEWHT